MKGRGHEKLASTLLYEPLRKQVTSCRGIKVNKTCIREAPLNLSFARKTCVDFVNLGGRLILDMTTPCFLSKAQGGPGYIVRGVLDLFCTSFAQIGKARV